jgi:hypothetical protein
MTVKSALSTNNSKDGTVYQQSPKPSQTKHRTFQNWNRIYSNEIQVAGGSVPETAEIKKRPSVFDAAKR